MEQGMTAIILSIFILFLFVPTVFLSTQNTNYQNIKKNLHFATTALADNVQTEAVNYDELSKGYERYTEGFDANKSNIMIDEDKLMVDFNNIIYKNCQDPDVYSKTQANILAKVLIYADRFTIIGPASIDKDYSYKTEFQNYKDGKVTGFNPSYYFDIYKDTNGDNVLEAYYLNTKNDEVRDINGNKLTITGIGLSVKEKNALIIKRINEVLSDYTNGVVVNFPNPADFTSGHLNIREKDLNFFEGVTFLVVYKENNYLNLRDDPMEFKNYVVAGYTLK